MSFAVRSSRPDTSAGPRRRLLILLGLLTVGVLVLDQVTKQIALANLSESGYIPLLGNFFGLTLAFNAGAAFSIASGSTWLFTIVAILVAVFIVRMAPRIGSRGWAIALGVLLGGNLGNLADRLFRPPGFARGHVVDFLNYNGWFVGNIADIAIVLGAIAMALLALAGVPLEGSDDSAVAEGADDDDNDDEADAAGSADDHEDIAAEADTDSGMSARRED